MKTLFIFAALILNFSCKDSKSLPPWLEQEIQKNFPQGKQTRVNPPAALKVFRYKYKDQDVYYIPPRCCDISSELFDSNGNILCSPDGGMSGHGDGKCADFFQTRTSEQVVWPK